MKDMKRKVLMGILVAVSAFGGGMAFTAGSKFFAPNEVHAASEIPTPEDLGNAFSAVAEAVNPAVVQVIPTQKVKGMANPFGGNSPFRFFFEEQEEGGENSPPRSRDQFQQGLGSGFLIREDGYIVTNNHVVKDATELEVKTFDSKTYKAKVIGTDASNDLAVIKIEGSGFPTVQLGEVTNLRVGQWVVAIGSPFEQELGNTVTAGIISAMGRNKADLTTFSSFIQTDAAINPGNSGGPLLNLQGKVIGVNSAILSRSGGFQGIGFAIPADIVRNSVDQIINKGKVSYGFLGLMPAPVPSGLARAMNLPTGGALVSSVNDDSPAQKSGLVADDVITAVNGRKINGPDQLRSMVANMPPGTKVVLTYFRDGKEKKTTVTLAERPAETLADAGTGAGGEAGEDEDAKTTLDKLGFSLENLTTDVRQRLKFGENASGVLVTDVSPIGIAFKEADLRTNFLIQFVGKSRNDMTVVKSKTDFLREYKSYKSGDVVYLRGQYPGGNTVLTAFTKP
ncbi:MAG: Do family serine endopeptidase [Bacteroidetes Order II. Incertae sedis bacterium]|nr:Do family serine endopeptidase [Bacteroidetes Order II. bacterium]